MPAQLILQFGQVSFFPSEEIHVPAHRALAQSFDQRVRQAQAYPPWLGIFS